jgi:c-di-GMP-binding flagellar brake protein YcgR
MNRRKYSRFHVELQCSFVGDQYTGEGTVLDLSMEGCRMRCDTSLLKGAYVELFINLLGQIPPLPVGLAVIRWSTGTEFGLEFIRIADRHQVRLRRYVKDLEQALMAKVPAASTGSGDETGMSER